MDIQDRKHDEVEHKRIERAPAIMIINAFCEIHDILHHCKSGCPEEYIQRLLNLFLRIKVEKQNHNAWKYDNGPIKIDIRMSQTRPVRKAIFPKRIVVHNEIMGKIASNKKENGGIVLFPLSPVPLNNAYKNEYDAYHYMKHIFSAWYFT
jgi:hypothetical protein